MSELLVLTWRGANILAQSLRERTGVLGGCPAGRLSDSEPLTSRVCAGVSAPSGFASHQCGRKSWGLGELLLLL